MSLDWQWQNNKPSCARGTEDNYFCHETCQNDLHATFAVMLVGMATTSFQRTQSFQDNLTQIAVVVNGKISYDSLFTNFNDTLLGTLLSFLVSLHIFLLSFGSTGCVKLRPALMSSQAAMTSSLHWLYMYDSLEPGTGIGILQSGHWSVATKMSARNWPGHHDFNLSCACCSRLSLFSVSLCHGILF